MAEEGVPVIGQVVEAADGPEHEILFIGGELHMHRQHVHFEEPPNELTIGDLRYDTAGELGYKWHPDEKAKGTWIYWHSNLMTTTIERVVDMRMSRDKRWSSYVLDLEAGLRAEADQIRQAQQPNVFSGITMIKFTNQQTGAIRLQWSWLGFEPREPLRYNKRIELDL